MQTIPMKRRNMALLPITLTWQIGPSTRPGELDGASPKPFSKIAKWSFFGRCHNRWYVSLLANTKYGGLLDRLCTVVQITCFPKAKSRLTSPCAAAFSAARCSELRNHNH